MSVLPNAVSERVAALFNRTADAEDPTLATLEELLREREATLDLTAEYGRPTPNLQDEPTAVFPYTLFDGDGEEYGTGAKEFPLPDNGLEADDSALAEFVAKRHGISAEEVEFADLAAVEGTTAPATLNDDGDVVVNQAADFGGDN